MGKGKNGKEERSSLALFEVAHFFMRIPREKPGLAQQMTPHFVTVGVPILEIPAKINVRDLKNAQLQNLRFRVGIRS
jgi:hypothetical protein